MYFFIQHRNKPSISSPSSGIGGALFAAAAVPAHGFIIDKGGLVHGATAGMAQAPAVGWIRTFLGACGWAFMIAAGSLVYSHFVAKWHAKGYPVLPVAALTAGEGLQSRNGGTISLGSGGRAASQSTPRKDPLPRQTSLLDEYEG